MGFADQALAALRRAREEIAQSQGVVSAELANVDSIQEHIRVAGDADIEFVMPTITAIRDALGQAILAYGELDRQLETRISMLSG